jgi:hypothetical protein
VWSLYHGFRERLKQLEAADGQFLRAAKASQILSAFDRIGQKKNKRRFPLARAEGTILQMFPGLWLA